MYDELIKRLRASCESCKLWDGYKCCLKGECSAQTRLQAADAIEELSKDRDNWKATAKEEREGYWHWFDQYQKDVLRWIPVTERLPLLNTPVLATDGIEVDISWMYGVPPRWITMDYKLHSNRRGQADTLDAVAANTEGGMSMSILINGLNMPTERESFNLTIKYNGTVLDTETGIQVVEAYELPPHGRLIDGDVAEVISFTDEDAKGGDFADGVMYAVDFISDMPTIIPADKEDG